MGKGDVTTDVIEDLFYTFPTPERMFFEYGICRIATPGVQFQGMPHTSFRYRIMGPSKKLI